MHCRYKGSFCSAIEAMNCGLPTFATNQGGPAEILVDGISGFHIDPNDGDVSSNKIADFFEKCKTYAEYWNKISAAGLQRIYECYTWKIYANKVLNMGSVYGFWSQMNKEQRFAKQRYMETFYNLQFKNLAKNVPIPEFASSTQTPSTSKTKTQETAPTALDEPETQLTPRTQPQQPESLRNGKESVDQKVLAPSQSSRQRNWSWLLFTITSLFIVFYIWSTL